MSWVEKITEVRFSPFMGGVISAASGVGMMLLISIWLNDGNFELDMIAIVLLLGSFFGLIGGLVLRNRRGGEWDVVSSVIGGLLGTIIILYFLLRLLMFLIEADN